METINIKNPHLLLEQAGNLAQINQNILNLQEELVVATQQISNAWGSDTIDKESYLKEINEANEKIATLVTAISALSKNLQYYAQRQISNANS